MRNRNVYIEPKADSWKELSKRPSVSSVDLTSIVSDVFTAVKTEGDKAIKRFTKQFDKVVLNDFLVSNKEIDLAVNAVSEELKKAIEMASSNIRKFHESQKQDKKVIETTPGVMCWQEVRPIERIGLYIPGGTAPLFSTVLMLAIPAAIANCAEIILCTPPNQKGEIDPAILYAAQLTGVTQIFKIGGVQAIAAMTYGTDSVPAVYKIFGPGNQYVTAAKQFALRKGVAIDMPAGPSELLVMLDSSANLAFVAADLLSQAEHGEDSQVVALLSDISLLDGLEAEINKQTSSLPRRDIVIQSLKNARFIVISDLEKRIAFVNQYCPEHLIICEKDEMNVLNQIQSAGSVFLGNYSPESAGDYASGTNHTLPTNSFAAVYSGVNLDAYVKKITVQKISKEGLANIGRTIEVMAEAEMLQAHKNAVSIRLKSLEA